MEIKRIDDMSMRLPSLYRSTGSQEWYIPIFTVFNYVLGISFRVYLLFIEYFLVFSGLFMFEIHLEIIEHSGEKQRFNAAEEI